MDSVISWIILDSVAFFLGIRFAIYVINQYEMHQEEKRDNDEW